MPNCSFVNSEKNEKNCDYAPLKNFNLLENVVFELELPIARSISLSLFSAPKNKYTMS